MGAKWLFLLFFGIVALTVAVATLGVYFSEYLLKLANSSHLDDPESVSEGIKFFHLDRDPSRSPNSTKARTAKNPNRKCNQCVGGNFIERRPLMQKAEIAQRMGWIEEWEQSDCLQAKNVNLIQDCQTACVTIWIQKLEHVNQSIYDSIAMDCADDLIYNSPDIPIKGYSYGPWAISFKGNTYYQNDRGGYRLTYVFSERRSADPLVIAEYLRKIVTPGMRSTPPYTKGTIVVWVIILGVFFVFFVAIFSYCCWQCCQEKRKTDGVPWRYHGTNLTRKQKREARKQQTKNSSIVRMESFSEFCTIHGLLAPLASDEESDNESFETGHENVQIDDRTSYVTYRCAPSRPAQEVLDEIEQDYSGQQETAPEEEEEMKEEKEEVTKGEEEEEMAEDVQEEETVDEHQMPEADHVPEAVYVLDETLQEETPILHTTDETEKTDEHADKL